LDLDEEKDSMEIFSNRRDAFASDSIFSAEHAFFQSNA